MPFFSFSIKEIKSSLTKFNITPNKVYFSKNTELWKILNKKNNPILNFLKYEKRYHITNIGKNIVFCLPPSIGLGDAIEYAMAIKYIRENITFDKLAIAFSGDLSFLFNDYFQLDKIYPNVFLVSFYLKHIFLPDVYYLIHLSFYNLLIYFYLQTQV